MAPLGHRFHICLEVCYHVSDSGRIHSNELPRSRAARYQMSCRSRIKSGMTDPASSLDFWIPTFIRLWRICRDDDSPQAGGMKRKILTLSLSPADCKKLSIYSQHPSPKGEGTSGNPTASGWGIKKLIQHPGSDCGLQNV